MSNGGSFFDAVRGSLERSRVKQEIRAAVRAKARGKSRDEARQLLIDELLERGQEVPAQPRLDFRLDAMLAAGDGPMDQAKASFEAAATLGAIGRQMITLLKSHADDDSTGAVGEAWFPVPGDPNRTAPVELDEGAQEWIGTLHEGVLFSFRSMSMLDLELRLGADGAVQVYGDGRRAGALAGTDADVFRPLFATFGRQDGTLEVQGSRYHSPQDGWQLYVQLPDERFL